MQRLWSPVTRRRATWSGAVLLMLAACAGPRAAAPPSAPATPAGRRLEAPSQPVAQPTATPVPTATPRAPFTGRPLGATGMPRRPVAVKIDNAPAARPQWGLSQAELVIEAPAEGFATRFTALFSEQDLPRVGPVRSARPFDLGLSRIYDFMLAYAGAGNTLTWRIAEQKVPALKAPELAEGILPDSPYFRTSDRRPPHNLYVNLERFRQKMAEAGVRDTTQLQAFVFYVAPPEEGSVRTIELGYHPLYRVVYRYDPATRHYRRFTAGQPHIDALTRQQVVVDNVIVQYVEMWPAPEYEPDSAGNVVLDGKLVGEGRAQIFHDGHAVEGSWVQPGEGTPPRFLDAEGRPVELKPGSVWIHLVPVDFQVTIG